MTNQMSLNDMVSLSENFNEILYNFNYSTKYSSFLYALSGITSDNIIHMPPMSHRGYVFFGRPKLNLSPPSIKQDRILSCLNTLNPMSLAFAIRCYLDPIYISPEVNPNAFNAALKSPLVRTELPFIPMLTNLVDELTGWDDPSLETESTEGGFFGENVTYAKGGTDFMKTINLTAKFSDIQGNPVLMLFLVWYRWIMLATKGVVVPYSKYIDENKVCYSMSIYRFRLDTSGRYITYWSRGCMCFPTSYPVSDKANYNKEETIAIHKDITIPITVNFSEHMDPITLIEFNMWIKRWCKDIESYKPLDHHELEYFKHLAVPYIDFTNGKRELQWRIDPSIELKTPEEKMEEILNQIKSL